MTGRVLSEDQIQTMAETWDLSTATREEYGESIIITNLIATIRDRDKTIVELREYVEQLRHERAMLEEQLGIPESLTVSKQEESTVSEVACEQTNKDSLHVARQNNPTHPMEQINRLAQEVASDIQWREGERT